LFVLGHTLDHHLKERISVESYFHNDIIQGIFIDDYYNLTLKTLFALNWANEHCANKEWIMNVDDDAIVNVAKLSKFVSYLSKNPGSTSTLHCNSNSNLVVRNPKSKWFLSQKEYVKNRYPSYCSGSTGCVLSRNVSRKLYETAMMPETQPKLWLEDTFVTGIAAAAAGIKHNHSSMFYPYLYDTYYGREEHLYSTSIVVGELKPAIKLVDFWVKATSPDPSYFQTSLEQISRHPICWESLISFLFIYLMAKVIVLFSKPLYKMLVSRIPGNFKETQNVVRMYKTV